MRVDWLAESGSATLRCWLLLKTSLCILRYITMYLHGVFGTAQLIISILLITVGVTEVRSLKRTDDFQFVECSWDGNTCAEIKEVNREQDDWFSDWPPGPFALPMPIDGCPESRLKGWEQGYIDFTWRDPFAVLTRNMPIFEEVDDNDTTVNLTDITLVQVTDIQSLIMGPYNRYRIKLNFCFKLRDDTTLDIGEWPDGSYGIYGDINGCPQGFDVEDKLIKLPKASFWISDGYLPYFQLNRRDGNEELRIRVCTRSIRWSVDSENEALPSKEPFVLLSGNKESPYQCSTDNEMITTKEMVYTQPTLTGSYNSTVLTSLMTYCYYWPIKWSDDFNETEGEPTNEPFHANAFVFSNVYISKGIVPTESYLCLLRPAESVCHDTNGLSEMLAHSTKAIINIEWTIIDLGRTIPVIAVVFPSLESEGFPKCFISNGKWDFLQYSALSCSYKVTGYYMHLNRIMEGRYVALTEDSSIETGGDRNVFEDNASIKVITTDHIFDYFADNNLPCNSDMGMTDLNIDDLDILTSSTQTEFRAEFARPFLSGWCAAKNDKAPFIMIRFHREVRINGITIWNWEETVKAVVNGIVEKQFFRMGTKSFKISFGLTEDNFTTYSDFKVDLMYQVDEPQYFRFYRPVHAKVVKIHHLEPLSQNMKCLRFELHGCRKTGIKHLQCTKSNDLKRYSGLVTPQYEHSYILHNKTLENCERACVENHDCTFLHLYSNGPCVQFNQSDIDQSDDQIWYLQEDVAGITSAKICESDYIPTPNVIYSLPRNSPGAVISYISVVNKERAISSIGYPLGYGYGESYKWVIQYREYEFIQLVFMNVSLTTFKHDANLWHCNDTIKFDEERNIFGVSDGRNAANSFAVDSSYNDRIFLIETRVYQLSVTFTTCLYYAAADHRGRGFRAIVQKQDVPTCFSVHDFNPLSDPHVEYCDMPVMYLTSLTYNNIPSYGVTEKWNIFHNTSTFRIDVLYFDVKCNSESEFILADRFKGPSTYCTLDRPPGIIYTASGSVEISLNKRNTLSDESFRLIYQTVKDLSPETVTVRASSIPDVIDSTQLEALEVLEVNDDNLDNALIHYGVKRTEQRLLRLLKMPRLLHKACSIHFNKCYMIYSHSESWEFAGEECWNRHQQLVSIRSVEELKLVKYLLRTFRMMDQYPKIFEASFTHNMTLFYNAYIGLRRYIDDKGKVYEMWEDKTPLTYTAWKSGEPLNGDCTRMGFHLAGEDMTWEATDCSKFTAFYFVCERDIGNRPIDIKDRKYAAEYRGILNTTENGLTCQRWDQFYPHEHTYTLDYFFPDDSVADAANYCREPSGLQERLFCYTTNPHVKIDNCFVNELQEEISPIVFSGDVGYRLQEQKCSRYTSGFFPNGTFFEVSGHCRGVPNTDFKIQRYLLCKVDNKGKGDLQSCSVKDTVSENCAARHHIYAGIQNSTVSGADCIKWKLHLSRTVFDLNAFPDKNLKKADNRCRDPFTAGFQWCYTTFPGKVWEFCNVDYGNLPHMAVDNSSAGTTMFTCRRGNHVKRYARCNGIIDCDDMSDEMDCHYQPHPLFDKSQSVTSVSHMPDMGSGSIYLCDSLELISYLAHCDGIVDCGDASDEINCTRTDSAEGGCDTDQFMCGNGVCVHVSLVCNFVSDCADSSDEMCDFPDCDVGEYTCASGQCIPSYQRCDAFEDCWDGTDENDCQSCSWTEAFNCDFIRCLPRRLVCDGYPDCEDRSDESSCDMSDVTSCKEWWEAGYRETKEYRIPSIVAATITVICDFTSVTDKQIITTIFHQVDLIEWEEQKVFYTSFDQYENPPEPYDDVYDFLVTADFTTNCTQQIVQSCSPSFDAASKYDDRYYNTSYIYCRCLNITTRIGYFEAAVDSAIDCDTGDLLSEDEKDYILFNITSTVYHRAIYWRTTNIPHENLRLQIGPVICEEEYYSDASTFGCGEARNVFNISMWCVYDTDRTGTIIGCRSRSHLQNCKHHECPEGTVKCPDSYCIPLRFVCDGIEQCPHAEDEFECGCDDTEREVVILHEDSDFRGPDLIKIARQLYATNGIIRSVMYKSKELSQGIPFAHRIMRISDKIIKPFERIDREPTCEYNVLANDFMNVVKFSKRTSRNLLFIQSSPESAVVANLMFSNITKFRGIHVYRISEGVDTATKSQFPYVKDVYVKNWDVLSALAARYFPKLCKEATMTNCPGAYKCATSKMCIQSSEVCDGYRHCIHGDDEFICNFTCPSECVCNGLTVSCRDSDYFNVRNIGEFPRHTRLLELRRMKIYVPLSEAMLDFPFLYLLNLSGSGIEHLEKRAFIKLSNLRILDISNNMLTALSVNVFAGLQHLHTLLLDDNSDISSLDPFTFQDLVSIRVLRITGTKLRVVMSNTFAGLSLEILDLQNNDIQEIEEFGLGSLAVNHIRFQGNDISTFHKGVFTGASSLKTLQTPAFKFCCIRPNYVSEDKCFPQKDEFSSCEDLMRISALQTMLWLIGLCALLGNVLSIIYRLIFDRERLKLGYGIFVTNLAVADFLMGVYLMIIAVADAVFRKRYIFMDDYWRNSSWCTFAGVLSTLSSEASVMFLCLITLDRLLVIKYPFGQVRFDTKKALMISVVAWITSLFIALFPLLLTGYFQNRFYNKSGVCIALPLTRDRPPGWLYSVLVFIGLNFVTFLLIAAGQWSIYMEIRKSSNLPVLRKSQSRKKDLTVARNLLLVVATDFLCWFPIGCMGLMAMTGYAISGDVYAWAAVFILPVNSALNPLLYTLTAILGKKSFTPSTNEQARDKIYTGLGKRVLASQQILCRRFYLVYYSTAVSYTTLQDCLEKFDQIPSRTVLKMAYQLSECLHYLHKNALVLKRIDESSVYFKTDKTMITGDIQIRHEPILCKKISDKRENVYNLGLFIKELISKSSK